MRRRDITAVAALEDALRARLYRFVRRAGRPVTRDEVAVDAGISRKLAAFHLERLVRSGLLKSTFTRPKQQAVGPGRAPKRYEPSEVQVYVTIPSRHYDVIGQILLEAIKDPRAGESSTEGARRVAVERGTALGGALRRDRRLGRIGPERTMTVAAEVLEAAGFEPALTGNVLKLRNCPFQILAQQAPDVVCGINLAFVTGLLHGIEARGVGAELGPVDGRCCVALRRS